MLSYDFYIYRTLKLLRLDVKFMACWWKNMIKVDIAMDFALTNYHGPFLGSDKACCKKVKKNTM